MSSERTSFLRWPHYIAQPGIEIVNPPASSLHGITGMPKISITCSTWQSISKNKLKVADGILSRTNIKKLVELEKMLS